MSATLFYTPPAECIVNEYRFLPDRYQAESAEGLLDFVPENIRKVLGGARRAIARAALAHFAWAFSRSNGGVRDEEGDWWVYKSARQLQQDYGQSPSGRVLGGEALESTKTFERTLLALVKLGVLIRKWVRIDARQGLGAAACYCYRPGPNWNEAVKDVKLSDGSDRVSQGSDTAVAQAETSSVTSRSARAGRRSGPNRTQEPVPLPVHTPADWAIPKDARPEVQMFPNDPNLATPEVQDAEPIEQPQGADDDNPPEAALDAGNTLNSSRRHWLSKIKVLAHGLYAYMGKRYSLDELAERPPIKAAGITREDLDNLVPF